MKYLITAIFGSLTFAFTLILIKIGILVVTDGFMWLGVGMGILMPAVVSALITIQAYYAAKEFKK